MARVIKIDNALQKRFMFKKKKKSKEISINFLIVCEGEKTEPNYFRSFPKRVGNLVYDVQFDGGGISTLKVVEKAIEIRDSSLQKFDRVWAVFDRDSFKSNSFNSAIQKAKANNIECAWSNQAFELWYLLHFHNRVTAMNREEYKGAIEEAVNAIIKKGKRFAYKKNDPNMFSLLDKVGNQDLAIRWARDLSEKITDEAYAKHNPATQVFKLVEELSGKSDEFNKEIIEKYENAE